MDITLLPGNPTNCPGNYDFCDECDYLICCTNFDNLCEKCPDFPTCPIKNSSCGLPLPDITD